MDTPDISKPTVLDTYAFYWSEARLILAAIALLAGGVPFIRLILPWSGLTWGLLLAAWLISGAASAYLLYRWLKHGQSVFGGKDLKDMVAFGVSVVSGLNLGLAGLISRNIGMSIFGTRVLLILAGIAYIGAAIYLWQRFSAHGKKVF